MKKNDNRPMDKKLLATLLDVPIITSAYVCQDEVYYSTYTLPTIKYKTIGLDKLGSMCKSLILKENMSIVSTFRHTFGQARLEWNEEMGFDRLGCQKQHSYHSDWQKAETEPEAIFKASELLKENNREQIHNAY